MRDLFGKMYKCCPRYLSLVFLLFLAGCGAPDDLKSPINQVPISCPTLLEAMPRTYGLFESGELPAIKSLIAESLTDAQFSALLDAILTIIRDLSPTELDDLSSLAETTNFQSVTQTLVSVFQFIGGTQDGRLPYRREIVTALRRIITNCEANSLLSAINYTLTSAELPDLLRDLSALMNDERFQNVLDVQGGLSRDGFAALVCNATNNLSKNDFSILNDIIQPIAALDVLPLDQPPINSFLRNLDLLLSDSRPLRPALANTVCCNLYDVPQCASIGPRTSVIDRPPVFVWAMHDILSTPTPQLESLLEQLRLFIDNPVVAPALRPLSVALNKISERFAVRQAIASVLRSLFEPDRAEFLMREVVALLNVGFVDELLQVVRLIAKGCQPQDIRSQ
ncbi:MAG: hypothetical protein VYA30_13520 [Myxococcota bacterium]|nr:hypothetical protein [Myxococcota bacterium]